jgi:2,5-diketo-D-gluconate reductase A
MEAPSSLGTLPASPACRRCNRSVGGGPLSRACNAAERKETGVAQSPTIQLNDGKTIPQLGFGVWQVPNDQAASIVKTAIEAGYRSIDTAAAYNNEEGVGAGLKQAGIARDQIYVTTKLWNSEHGYSETLKAFDASMKRLGLEQLDLYLIHWPVPQRDAYVETWRAFIKLQEEGRIRSIGVSNFTISNLERIIDETGVKPVLNQIELHPRFQQKALRDFHAEHGIATEAWSPLGRGALLDDPTLAELARQYGKSPAQIVLRWHLDSGNVVIPKSATPARIRENFSVFDFKLAPDDMAKIARLDDKAGRIGPDPETFG